MMLDAERSRQALAGVDLDLVNAYLGIGGWYSDSDRTDGEEVFAILMDARHVYRWSPEETDRRLSLAGLVIARKDT